MWKEFFFFNRTQRIGIVVLIILLLLVVAANIALQFVQPTPTTFSRYEKEDYKLLYSTLQSRDSLRNAEREIQYNNWNNSFGNNKYDNYAKANSSNYSLFDFDPNMADSSTLVQLGLRPYIASNILKFRSKGGKFRDTESFGKTYGLSDEKFEELKPFIKIDASQWSQPMADSTKNTFETTKKTFAGTLDLNTADTTSLMQIKGIGRGYARAIVRFRAQAGGYVNKEQLRELPHMTQEKFESIEPFFTINSTLVRKINVNIASVDRLKGHPYLNFYQAKALYEYRRKKGKIKNIDELKHLEEFDTETITKIQPYLQFEQ